MGLIRLIIIGGIGYLIYRIIKGLFKAAGNIEGRRSNGVIDEMVQDPQCKTYIPQREAKRKIIRGSEFYFCSEECAEKFRSGMDQ